MAFMFCSGMWSLHHSVFNIAFNDSRTNYAFDAVCIHSRSIAIGFRPHVLIAFFAH